MSDNALSLTATQASSPAQFSFFHLGGAAVRTEKPATKNLLREIDDEQAQRVSRRDKILREGISMTQVNADPSGQRGHTVAFVDTLISRRKAELKEDERFDAAALMPTVGRSASIPLDRLLTDEDRSRVTPNIKPRRTNGMGNNP